MSVARAQSEIHAREFVEWWQEYQESPWGAERDDLRIATLVAQVANMLGAKKSRPFTGPDFVGHFLPKPPTRRPQSAAEQQAVFRQITLAAGGTVHHGPGR